MNREIDIAIKIFVSPRVKTSGLLSHVWSVNHNERIRGGFFMRDK